MCNLINTHKQLAIRRVEHRSKIHSNEFQHLAEGVEVARLRRRFSFILQQTPSFRTRHHLCRQGVALAGTGQLRPQGPVSVNAYCTERVTGSKGKEQTGPGVHAICNREGLARFLIASTAVAALSTSRSESASTNPSLSAGSAMLWGSGLANR